MMIDILYDFRHLFEVYPFSHKEYKKAIKTPQRFENCNTWLEGLIPLPPRALFARRYFPDKTRKAAKALMDSAIEDFKSYIVDPVFDFRKIPDIKLDKINGVEAVAGYPNDMIEDAFLDRIYEKLDLNGNETLFETFRELKSFYIFFKMIDLSPQDLLTVKIGSRKGGHVFACSLISFKYLCEWN